MQNIIDRLQAIIKAHYGYSTALEFKPLSSYQSLQRDLYSQLDRCLSIPLFEPKTQRPIAYFKIFDIGEDGLSQSETLSDLVNITLQSYINLLDELEVADNLIQYLQMELQPHKIIRLHSEMLKKKLTKMEIQDEDTDYSMPLMPVMVSGNPEPVESREILIYSRSRKTLDRLALALHEQSGNHFFIRLDHMPKDFLSSINDLLNLGHTTFYIPRIQNLNPIQQKTLETFMSMQDPRDNILLIFGTRSPVSHLEKVDNVSPRLLEQLHLFHLLSENSDQDQVKFESLSQCASAILGTQTHGKDTLKTLSPTKSYNIIPSCDDLYPTIH